MTDAPVEVRNQLPVQHGSSRWLVAYMTVVELAPVAYEIQQDPRMAGEADVRLDGVSPFHLKPRAVDLELELLPREVES